ncbi:MAG: D-2-hydroxyacid dehydrogenase [Anaerolineales bacterium]|nr:D-2-hydroxyacid dehydrogenase [Anaerolineales bacterium]
MTHLHILSADEEIYRAMLAKENLPDLIIDDQLGESCEIILGEPSRIHDKIADLPNLRWIQSTWAGVEPLLNPALRRDYKLTNARGIFGELMSEYVFAYLLAHERRIFARAEAQKNKIWDGSLTGTIRGKTIGLIGVGTIGAEMARTAKFFGLTVRGYTRQSEDCPDVDHYYHGEELLEFANELDYLVNVAPNTKETRKIIGADLLAALPARAVLINVGRGPAVDESALLQALNEKKIASAVLDVFEKEPLPTEHPFWTTPNLTMTYHTSGPSFPSKFIQIFIENYRLYKEDKPLKYQINFERGY